MALSPVPTYTTIKPKVVSSMAFDTFTRALDSARLQRAADLMLQDSFLRQKLDVTPMIQASPSG